MDKKSKLIYLTPDQQQWLTTVMTDVLDNGFSPVNKISAAAILKKLQGRTATQTQERNPL